MKRDSRYKQIVENWIIDYSMGHAGSLRHQCLNENTEYAGGKKPHTSIDIKKELYCRRCGLVPNNGVMLAYTLSKFDKK